MENDMTYKTLVAGYLQRAVDTRLTLQEIADRLDVGKGSYITMLIGANYPHTLLSPSRIPALVELCGLTPDQVIDLVGARVNKLPESPFQMSRAMYHLLLKSTVLAADSRRAACATKGAGRAR
jgi:hypothetical protein